MIDAGFLKVHFGAPFPHSFVAVYRAKVGDLRLQRKILLEGHRFTPPEALQDGILDYVVNGKTAEVLAKAEEVADRVCVLAATGVWGLIKVCHFASTCEGFAHGTQLNLYGDVLETIQHDLRLVTVDMDEAAAKVKL
jgi:enoyl-CoA hydratase/carnithine racemase